MIIRFKQGGYNQQKRLTKRTYNINNSQTEGKFN